MKDEPQHNFEKEMREKYPLLYRDMWGSPQQTCMAFGISVGEGWFPIIEGLSAKLEPKIREIKERAEFYNLRCESCGHKKQWHWLFYIGTSVLFFFKNLRHWPKMAWGQFKRNRSWVKIYKNNSRFNINRNIFNNVFCLPRWYIACKTYRLPFPCAAQVKEKFGGARFYMTTYNEEIEKLISEMENLSYKTCECCGAPGQLRDGGWVKTLCDECHGKRKND